MSCLSEYLLVSDLDGTLLLDGHTVHPRNIEAVTRFQQKGGRFAIATGRTHGAAKPILCQIQVNAPIITANGGCILDADSGEVVWETYLSQRAKEYVREIWAAFPEFDLDIFPEGEDDVFLFSGQNKEWTNVFVRDHHPHCWAQEKDWDRRWRKCIFECPEDQKARFDAYLAQNKSRWVDVAFTNSSACFYEMLPKESSKGAALERLAHVLQVPREHVVAVGDFDNDLSMIRYAGIGAFTADASPELKKEADFITGSYLNGAVADVIEYLESLCGE